MQGDIVAVYDESGTILISYRYNAWGECSRTPHNDGATTAAYNNPFRYRGYCYESSLDMYYLGSRYYDQRVGRFINADGYVSTGQGILGNNMYIYCGNNPVTRVDPTGNSWTEIWAFVQTAVTEIGKAISVASPVYAVAGGVAALDGPIPIGDAVALSIITVTTGIVI